jgi:hypothetical protein
MAESSTGLRAHHHHHHHHHHRKVASVERVPGYSYCHEWSVVLIHDFIEIREPYATVV